MVDPEANDSKLVRTKLAWAREGRFLSGRQVRPDAERLPPGQHLVQNWPVLDLGLQPHIPRETWRLDVTGEVAHQASWSFSEFMALTQHQITSDIHCVTSWSRYDNLWTGVSTQSVLEAVSPPAAARFVVLYSEDGYTTNLALEDFVGQDAILAHAWSGLPLSVEHGGPVRLVIPHLYFWKSAKWLRRIDFRTEDSPGFWEVRGYHNHADPWTEERYSND